MRTAFDYLNSRSTIYRHRKTKRHTLRPGLVDRRCLWRQITGQIPERPQTPSDDNEKSSGLGPRKANEMTAFDYVSKLEFTLNDLLTHVCAPFVPRPVPPSTPCDPASLIGVVCLWRGTNHAPGTPSLGSSLPHRADPRRQKTVTSFIKGDDTLIPPRYRLAGTA